MRRKLLVGFTCGMIVCIALACQYLSRKPAGGIPTPTKSTIQNTQTTRPTASPAQSSTFTHISPTQPDLAVQVSPEMQQTIGPKETESLPSITPSPQSVTVQASQSAEDMANLVNQLRAENILHSTGGVYYPIEDFEENWPQIGWYQWWTTGYGPKDFVLSAQTSWESASRTADWFNSGCGFVFRENGVENHYVIYLGLDGYVYLKRYVNGQFQELERAFAEKVDFMKGQADVVLAVEGNNISYYVNGKLVLQKSDAALKEGNLGLTLVSGSNKDFGTRCKISNIRLWDLNGQTGSATIGVTDGGNNLNWPVVVSDDFERNQSSWPEGNEENAFAAIQRSFHEGAYRLDIQSKQAANVCSTANASPEVTSFSASVKAWRVDGPNDAAYGIVFRQVDEQNFYYFAVIDRGMFYVSAMINQQWEILYPPETASAIFPGAQNQLAVIGEGNQFTFFINGQQVAELQDSRLAKGKVGLGADLSGPSHLLMEFDNFEVRAP